MISTVNDFDLGLASTKRLELLLKNELYINIDSPFAEEIQTELEDRYLLAAIETENG